VIHIVDGDTFDVLDDAHGTHRIRVSCMDTPEKEGDTVAHVFRLLCHGHVECVKDSIVGWRFDDLRNVTVMMRILFNHQNAMYERLALSENMNERVSEEIAQLLECSLT